MTLAASQLSSLVSSLAALWSTAACKAGGSPPSWARLREGRLFLGAAGLTALNDTALITYLATPVPDLPASARFAVVSDAVVGGGLTVIANAPNPAGQAIRDRHFESGISPLGLLLGALVPTVILAVAFRLFV